MNRLVPLPKPECHWKRKSLSWFCKFLFYGRWTVVKKNVKQYQRKALVVFLHFIVSYEFPFYEHLPFTVFCCVVSVFDLQFGIVVIFFLSTFWTPFLCFAFESFFFFFVRFAFDFEIVYLIAPNRSSMKNVTDIPRANAA